MKISIALLAVVFSAQVQAQAQVFELSPGRATECRAQLRKSICYSEPTRHWAEAGSDSVKDALVKYQNRTCDPVPEEYVKALLGLFDSYPDAVKAAFCEIKRVFVVKGDVDYGARAEYFFNEEGLRAIPNSLGTVAFRGTPTGYILEISEKNRLKSKEESGQKETRVVQARYGRNIRAEGVSNQLPVVRHETPFGDSGALAMTIVHEIGHMLSRAHRATSLFFSPVKSTPWTDLSWMALDDVRFIPRRGDVELWQRVVTKKVSPSEVTDAQSLLKTVGFASYYAASNPEEDFAETFMLNFYDNFAISVAGTDVLDFKRDVEMDPILKAKRNYVRGLINSSSNPYGLSGFGEVGGFFVRRL